MGSSRLIRGQTSGCLHCWAESRMLSGQLGGLLLRDRQCEPLRLASGPAHCVYFAEDGKGKEATVTLSQEGGDGVTQCRASSLKPSYL